MRIGLISDTHGLMRPEALNALEGSDLIVHAGDIGSTAVLDALCELAPLTVVRGNNDRGAWADTIPQTDVLEAGEVLIYVLHDVAALDIDPAAASMRVVVAGHSHVPGIREEGGVLYVNPGSAGPRRFKLPVTVGLLEIAGAEVSARVVELDVR